MAAATAAALWHGDGMATSGERIIMAKYRLLAGAHEQPDPSKPVLGPDRKPVPGRFQTQRFTATAASKPVVESDQDLVALFGPQRFELVGGQAASDAARIADLEKQISELKARRGAESAGGLRVPGDPTPDNLVNSPAVAPGGQVSTGFQGGAPEDAKKAAATGAGGAEEFDDGYEEMTVKELREVAAEDEVDLKGATHKDEIIARLRGQR